MALSKAQSACKHEAIACPRCGAYFACKPGAITICHCVDIALTTAQQEWIAERWQDCLCSQCLRDIAARPVKIR
ncbi:cysteine-rich CWC family protein [Spongiibacter taiwanensis]|uniref:cysteine-rich CWC family protein n=1 Tax=Spongiibacter taiwanensis TaxID=1748242 RepID=UPI0020359031|nr:cysteine-rich CWC family protein [Spongiibacter taiwanensis]USA43742.1 cysteine-rich CWC family protein [Spongiibacter taiwanensis]